MNAEVPKSGIEPRQTFVCPGQVVGSRWEKTRGGLALFLGAVGVLDGGLGLLETRERNADLEGALGVQIEEMVLAANRFVGNALLFEQLT